MPREMTTFIGRGEDLARLDDLIADHRLVTLLGPGGIGKTRLALAAAARQVDHFPDGVWLVELASVMAPELVITELADVWGLRAGEGSSLEEVVIRYLATRQLLVVVDNCEHVRDAAATLLRDVLRAAPDVSVVATSRESLGVAGEAEYRVPALGLPEGVTDASVSEAVTLFLDRVRAFKPELVESDADLEALGRICRRLEGMPLGIELAAARIRFLSPAELADRLDTSFLVLGSSKGSVDRQRTLETTLDWSHNLLTSDEQAVFRRMSVFAGGFDVGAAEAVCAAGLVEAGAVLDHLDSLVDKSLVLTISGPRARFRLLEPIRQYGERRLRESGETEPIRLAHGHFYAALGALAEGHIRSDDQLEWSRRLDTDHDNLRLALVTLREAGEQNAYLDLCFDLYLYWEHDGMHQEGIAAVLAGLESAALATPSRVCKGWYVAANLAFELSDPRSVEYAERGLEAAKASGDLGAVGRLMTTLGYALQNTTDRSDGDAYVVTGTTIWLEHHEPLWWDAAWEMSYLALARGAFAPTDHLDRRRDLERAIQGFSDAGDLAYMALALLITDNLDGLVDDDWIFGNLEGAVRMARSSGYRQILGHALYYWGAKRRIRGEGEACRDTLVEAAVVLGAIGDALCSNGAALHLITLDALSARREEARSRLISVARSVRTLKTAGVRNRTIDAACLVALAFGDYKFAARLLGRSERTGVHSSRLLEVSADRSRLEALMTPRDLDRLVAEGATMTVDEALTAIAGWAEPVRRGG